MLFSLYRIEPFLILIAMCKFSCLLLISLFCSFHIIVALYVKGLLYNAVKKKQLWIICLLSRSGVLFF